MICIYCFHEKTRVTNSRPHKKVASTWRRHECLRCGKVFSTNEAPVMGDSYTITSDTPKESAPYTRTRLSASLLRAFGHLSGTALYETVDRLCDTIESKLMASAHDGTAGKDELAAIAYEVLKNYDAVAGIQYAAQNGLVSAVNPKRRGRPSLRSTQE